MFDSEKSEAKQLYLIFKPQNCGIGKGVEDSGNRDPWKKADDSVLRLLLTPTTNHFGPTIKITITVRNPHPCHMGKIKAEPFGSQ